MSQVCFIVSLFLLLVSSYGLPQFAKDDALKLVKELRSVGKKCAETSGSTFEELISMLKSDAVDVSDDIKCAYKCFLQTSVRGNQMMQENGDIVAPATVVALSPDIQDCANKVDSDDHCEKAWLFHVQCGEEIKKVRAQLIKALN